MTETEVGQLKVTLTADSSQVQTGVDKAKDKLDEFKKKCSETTKAGNYLKEGFNQVTEKITGLISPAHVVEAGLAAVAAAMAGVVVVGDKMNEVFDDLQVGTGALGSQLDDLNKSLKTVIGTTSTTADKLSTAMANLNTYLGLTGEELESLTQLFSKYSDITGKDVGTATEKASKAFNLWEVQVEDMSRVMNQFYGISQATGIGVEELFAAVTDGAAFLQRFGYSIEEAGVELASFEKYGISAAGVITGMKMAVANMTKQGIEPNKEAWDALKESIASAQTDMDAMSIATEYFGTRYAADMVDAIKLANKAVGELGNNVDGLSTALNTSIELQENGGMAEAWTTLSNKLALAAQAIFERLEPALTWLIGAFTTLLDVITPIFRAIGMLIDTVLAPLNVIITVIAEALDWLKKNVLDPILEWVNDFLDVIQPIVDFFNGIGKGIADLLGLTSSEGDAAKQAMDEVGNSVDKAADSMLGYCNSLDSAISKTKELSALTSGGEDPYVNTGMNYHIENGYKIYADGTRVKDGGTVFNNNITVQGGGYPSEEMARMYAYTQALNALKSRY